MSAKATSGVEVVSLGCRMNLAESERMQAMLAQEGDLVVINSCAVTAEALRRDESLPSSMDERSSTCR